MTLQSGSKAAKSVDIIWENAVVTKSTKGGSFQFQGTVPSNCIGTLSDGVSTMEVALNNCVPTPALYPIELTRTGQTHSVSSQYGIPGDDGDLQRGVPWPDPRFIDNNDGTVTDRLTNLVWLKDMNCFGAIGWYTALHMCNALKSYDGGTVNCGKSSSQFVWPVRSLKRN